VKGKSFMSAQEVANELGISISSAYKIVKELNEEMEQLGYLTIRGRVNTAFFHQKLCYTKQ
jgi:Mga helix-turn-helix domain.